MTQKHRRSSASTAPIRRPARLPFLDAICKRLNQRVNLNEERSVLALYERGWIFHGVLGTPGEAETRYIRSLAARYQSWIEKQVA